jgi:hypothetical protein
MAEKLLEQLELVDVIFEDNKKATLVFLDSERGEIREVNFNKQVYNQDTKKFVDDAEKAQKCEEWAEEHFELPFDRLAEAIGEKRDVYCYDNFNSLFPVKMVTKFEDDMLGQMLYVDCVDAFDDGKKIAIQFEYEGNLYESKMQYADYVEARKEWFINPIKQKKQYDKFKEKFQIDVENVAELIGKPITVEVKKAMGKYMYSEVKPFAKPKKGKGA